jgi:hypothetical protein
MEIRMTGLSWLDPLVFVFIRFARGGGSLAHHGVKSITLFFSHDFTGKQFLIFCAGAESALGPIASIWRVGSMSGWRLIPEVGDVRICRLKASVWTRLKRPNRSLE